MQQLVQSGTTQYSAVGDIAVIALCLVMIILLLTSYVTRTRSYQIFVMIVGLLAAAALINITYHTLLGRNTPSYYNLIYVLRILYNALLFDVLFLFVLYTTVVCGMDHKKARIVAVVSMLLLFGTVGTDVVRMIIGKGFRITEDGRIVNRTNIYVIGYILFILLLVLVLSRTRKLLFRHVPGYGLLRALRGCGERQ